MQQIFDSYNAMSIWNAFQYVGTARDDYICTKNNYNSCLQNDDWKIHPSITFLVAYHIL